MILGCTHYPLLRPIFQRTFGRDVTLVFSADETAREVAETLARKGFDNDPSREGAYTFLTTGDADALPRARRALPAAAARLGRPRRGLASSRPPREHRRPERGMRADGRRSDELRPVVADPTFLEQPHGMVLWSQGKTRVLCTASVAEGVPRWLYRSGRGWMTAEYSLLPASTGERTEREAARGKQGGRTVEIQRLIGRALRGVVDFEALGERTVWLDCDVLQADGGTRCAAICGAYVAARRALDRFGLSKALTGGVAAVSVGVVGGEPLLDLDYSEDSTADVDVNVVMTGDGRLVEVQATAERVPFDRELLDALLDLAAAGIEQLQRLQEDAVAVPRWLASRRSRTGSSSPASRAATGLGAALGIERELREHEAGFRTHLLVCLGSALFTDRLGLRLRRTSSSAGRRSSAPTRRGSQRRSSPGSASSAPARSSATA